MASNTRTGELTPIQAIILALTVQRSQYPYELASHVERGVYRSFFKVSTTATYNALKRLEALGFVTTVAQPGGLQQQLTKRRWDRRCWYQATDEGRDAYQRWLTSKKQLKSESERTEILGRIASAAQHGTQALRAILDDCEALCDQREQTIDAVQALNASHPIDALCDHLVIIERKLALRALREWIQVARAHVHAYEQRYLSDNRRSHQVISVLAGSRRAGREGVI